MELTTLQWHQKTLKTGLVLHVEVISSFSLLIFFGWFSTRADFGQSNYPYWQYEAIP